ncbi:unnamed protein product [Bursaphelenchus xylophilus]|uniref:(pine wood nematode) hypothetical protein n=1 Tax=Bursaphelenchus xylophilus TaxID=6326 RepID=A0A1I7SM43_BURXY|nr:unnamed protein product [Bursaphelenchus xylophilus]CAG9129992.1 unnamed protein product [Bursaphelenchus xylophilus]
MATYKKQKAAGGGTRAGRGQLCSWTLGHSKWPGSGVWNAGARARGLKLRPRNSRDAVWAKGRRIEPGSEWTALPPFRATFHSTVVSHRAACVRHGHHVQGQWVVKGEAITFPSLRFMLENMTAESEVPPEVRLEPSESSSASSLSPPNQFAFTLQPSNEKLNELNKSFNESKPFVDIKSESSDSVEIPNDTPLDAPIHEVRCGTLNAKLHMQRFTCPGIHRRCIEFNGLMITPREFTIKAEKDKQKDWKGSIRFGRYNLRTMMETKGLDFYHHDTNCSLKCQSRNYIKNRKSEAMESGFSLLDSMVSSAESRTSSNNGDHNDENGDHLRKRSSVLEDYVSQTIQSLNGNSLSRLMKEEAQIKPEDTFSFPNTNSTTTSVSSPPTQPLLQQEFVQQPQQDVNLLLHQLLEQQKLVQQQPLPQQQLLQSLMQTVQKSQNPQDTNALLQMAAVALQMNNQQHQMQQQQLMPGNFNILEQCLINQGINQLNNNGSTFPMVQQAQLPYLNENTFSVASIRKVMEEEPQLFWSKMKDLGCLDEMLDSISLAVDRLRSLYSKRESTSSEEEFAARRLSGMANLLDLGGVFGEKLQARFMQSAFEAPVVNKDVQMVLALQQAAKRHSQAFEDLKPDLKKIRMV